MCTTHFETLPLPTATRRLLEAVSARGVRIDQAVAGAYQEANPLDQVARQLLAELGDQDVWRQGGMLMLASHETLHPADRDALSVNTLVHHPLRSAVVARPGHQLVAVDLAAPAVAALAYLAEDDLLTEALMSGDPYAYLNEKVFLGERTRADVKGLFWRWLSNQLTRCDADVAGGGALTAHLVDALAYRGATANLRHVYRLAAQVTRCVFDHAAAVSGGYGGVPVLAAADTLVLEVPLEADTDSLAAAVFGAPTPAGIPVKVRVSTATRLT